LKKNIIGLSLTSMFTDMSSESIYAVLPFYITSLGLGREIVGLVEGLGELFASLFKFLSGYIAQAIGRYKLLTFIGYFLSTLFKPLFAFTNNSFTISLVKVADRIGKGIRTSPRDALIASSSSTKYTGRAFGLHRMFDTIGAVLGPLLAIILLGFYGYVGVFLFSIIPGSLALLILLIFVEERKASMEKSEEGGLSLRSFPLVYWLFILTVVFIGLTGYTQAFLLLRSREIGFSEEYSIGFLIIANIVYASLAYPIGFYSDVLRKGTLYPLIYVAQIIGAFMIILLNTGLAPLVFFIVYGVFMAFQDTLTRIMTRYYVKPYLRGVGYGIMHSLYGLSALTGYYLLGYIYEKQGYAYAFTYSIAIGFIGLVLSIILVYMTRRAG